MRAYYSRVFALLVGIGVCPLGQGFGQENERPKTTPFQQTANELLAGSCLQLIEYWHLPHYSSWSKLKGGDFDAELQKRYKCFPDDLINAIGNQESADQEAAAQFLAGYVGLARSHAALLAEKDLSLAVDRALAPHTDKLRQGLIASLKAKGAKTRLLAALALMSLDDRHARAIEVFQAIVMSDDAELLPEACRYIGLARLTSPQAIEFLGRVLKHRDPQVRESAAGAIITLGPSARDLVPALIAFLETGEKAMGDYCYPFAIALPQRGNLALMALESLKEHSKLAVPTILARFTTASDEDQFAMFKCLASIGCKDDACLAMVRKSLQSEKSKLKLAAACALLHLTPGDREATDVVKKALADNPTKNLTNDICQQFGPPSREIAASLIPMLDDENEDVRIGAMRALAQIGPHAADAVPAIEKLLAREENGMTHTFLSTRAAAFALAKIRGKKAADALLRVADSKASGSRYAFIYLLDLGDDLPPTTLAFLIRAIQDDDRPKDMAAIALSNLGERARSIRRDLERSHDDPAVGWIINTALRRIPSSPP